MSGRARRPRKRTQTEQAAAKRLLAMLRGGRDVRSKVGRIRARLRQGDFDNDFKLTIALERLIGELRED